MGLEKSFAPFGESGPSLRRMGRGIREEFEFREGDLSAQSSAVLERSGWGLSRGALLDYKHLRRSPTPGFPPGIDNRPQLPTNSSIYSCLAGAGGMAPGPSTAPGEDASVSVR